MASLHPIDITNRREAGRRSALDVHICLVELANNRSAMLLDVSEVGMGVQSVEGPGAGLTSTFRFQLPDTDTIISGEAEIAWADRAGRMGMRFSRISPEMRAAIAKWVASDANPLFADQPTTEDQADLDARDRVAQLEARIIVSGWAQIQALNFLVDQIAAMTQASGVAIAVEDGTGIVCKASSGTAPQVGVRVDPRSGLSWECVRTREVVQCVDTETDPRVDRLVCRQLNMRSAMLVPVMKDGRIAGLVEVFSSRAHAFNNQTVILLRRVGEAVASLDETAPDISEEALIPPQVEAEAAPLPAFESAKPSAPAVVAKPELVRPKPETEPAPVAVKPAIAIVPPAVVEKPEVVPPPVVKETAMAPVPAEPIQVEKPVAVATPEVLVQQIAPQPPEPKPVVPPPQPAIATKPVSAPPVVAPVATAPAIQVPVARTAPAVEPPAPRPPVMESAPIVEKPLVEKVPVLEKAVTEKKSVVATSVTQPAPKVEPPVKKIAPAVAKVEATPARVPTRSAPLPAVAFSGAAAAATPAFDSPRTLADETTESDIADDDDRYAEVSTEGRGRVVGIGVAAVVVVVALGYGGWRLTRPKTPSTQPPTQTAQVQTPPVTPLPVATSPVSPATNTDAAKPGVKPATPATKPNVTTPQPQTQSVAQQPASEAETPIMVASREVPPPSTTAPSMVIAPPNTVGVASILSNPVPAPSLGSQKVSQGVTGGKQLLRVQPLYPQAARTMRLSGIVVVRAHVSKKGTVSEVEVISGPSLLRNAAADAVKRWKYEPFLLNGQPIENEINVQVRFDLPQT